MMQKGVRKIRVVMRRIKMPEKPEVLSRLRQELEREKLGEQARKNEVQSKQDQLYKQVLMKAEHDFEFLKRYRKEIMAAPTRDLQRLKLLDEDIAKQEKRLAHVRKLAVIKDRPALIDEKIGLKDALLDIKLMRDKHPEGSSEWLRLDIEHRKTKRMLDEIEKQLYGRK